MEKWSEKITEAVGSPASLIVHTLIFLVALSLPFFGISFDRVLLVLTTVVSLEAIYLALFIQMTVNRHTESLEDIEEDVEEISEDIGEIGEDIEDISEDLEETQEEIDQMREEELEYDGYDKPEDPVITDIRKHLAQIAADIDELKKR